MRDIIVIGSPKGGSAALAQVVSGFPPNLDASVFVALHVEPETPILLADVLNAPGRMRATEAMHDEPIQQPRIYVAAQDKHLMIRQRRIFLFAAWVRATSPSDCISVRRRSTVTAST